MRSTGAKPALDCGSQAAAFGTAHPILLEPAADARPSAVLPDEHGSERDENASGPPRERARPTNGSVPELLRRSGPLTIFSPAHFASVRNGQHRTLTGQESCGIGGRQASNLP